MLTNRAFTAYKQIHLHAFFRQLSYSLSLLLFDEFKTDYKEGFSADDLSFFFTNYFANKKRYPNSTE
ncbi:hypothetical protein RV11_GL000881 [Enterococcus phoeniculicola]|nr:hypothetical protein RV11_GL000881 [Enterococcus phoeniculicola]